MLKFFVLLLFVSIQTFAADEIHITGPGIHFFTTKQTDFDLEYGRVGMPESGCVDVCDQFGCNRTGSGSMCQPTSSMPYPTNIRNVLTDVELEILPAPEGMELDEYFVPDLSLNFKGSKKFAFLRTTKNLPEIYVQGAYHKRVKITLRPLKLQAILNSVTLDKHVSIIDGILTYGTLGSGTLKTLVSLGLKKEFNVFRGDIQFNLGESQIAPYRTTTASGNGLRHTVDLNKVLKKPLPRGKYTFSMRQTLEMNESHLLVESEFRQKLESTLWYTVTAY